MVQALVVQEAGGGAEVLAGRRWRRVVVMEGRSRGRTRSGRPAGRGGGRGRLLPSLCMSLRDQKSVIQCEG